MNGASGRGSQGPRLVLRGASGGHWQEQWQRLSATIGKLLIDLGKLFFGSLMLGSILKGDVDLLQMFVFGAAAAMALFTIGVWFVSMSEE